MKILIVKIGAIGDVVMCLPLVTHIKKKHPNAHISWLCGKTVTPILQEIKEIDEIIEVDDSKLLGNNILKVITEIFRTCLKLFGTRYDLGLYYYYTNKYKLLLSTVKIKEIRCFNRFKKQRLLPIPQHHHTYDYLWSFEMNTGPYQYDIEYPKISNIETNLNLFVKPDKKKFILSPGGAKNLLSEDSLRRWPIENYVSLAQNLILDGHTVTIIGGPLDNWVEEYFAHLNVHNLIGKYKLLDTIRIISKGDILITHDSGPLHLADLANIPSIGLFGPTSPYSFKSLHPKSKFIWGGQALSCRPCYDGKAYEKCSSNDCMKEISVSEVMLTLNSFI